MAAVPGAIAEAPSPTRAGVFGMARTTAVPSGRAASSAAIVTPAAIDRTRPGPDAPMARHAAGTSPGFTARTVPSAGAGVSSHVDAREGLHQRGTARRVRLDDAHVAEAAPAGLEQPAEEGLAHPAPTDHLELDHAMNLPVRSGDGGAPGGAERRTGGGLAHPFPERVVTGPLPPPDRTVDQGCMRCNEKIIQRSGRRTRCAAAGRKKCSTYAYSEPRMRSSSSSVDGRVVDLADEEHGVLVADAKAAP